MIDPVARATSSLAHRGPDDEGIEFISDSQDQGLTVAFSHRRLAILDLSATGHQPMRDELTGNWITYNGEVFNFREVRRKLGGHGLKFKSESDTEVILKGYGLLGNNAITDWRGMFAFGLWDERKRQLVLVRDRLGIKPLYYYYNGESFIFASEIRALLATGLIPRKLSHAALESYLTFGSVQQPLTIIENVYALLPGHILTFNDGQIGTNPYWELRAEEIPTSRNQHAFTDGIGELLLESVRLRLISDVPVGVFLSGGIDSSSVVALIRHATSADIKSFSVCFREREFSEKIYAEQIAQQYATDHHSILLTEDEILARLPAALHAMDQPSLDGINSYVVSEATAQAGLKVAISGLGGDEVFAGYDYFRTIERDEWRRVQARRLPRGMRRAAAAAITAVASGNRATKLRGLLRGDQLDEHALRLHRRLFTCEQQAKLLAANGFAREQETRDEALLRAWTNRQFARCAGADPVNQASVLDLGGYMCNTLLRDTDAMSMAHSLEVRVPLIDHLLVERMLAVPGRMKLRDGKPKWLLVDAVGDLPREIVYRPKRGFELPFKHWLLGALRNQVVSALSEPSLDGIFQSGALQEIWRDFEAGRVSWTRVWSLYVLDEWARINI